MNEWIEWSGETCPVNKEAMVDYIVRCGRGFNERMAGRLYWGNLGSSFDIVFYRLSKEQDGGQVE